MTIEPTGNSPSDLSRNEADQGVRGRPQAAWDLLAAVDDSPRAIFVLGGDGRFLAANKAFCEAVGHERGELLAMDVWSLLEREAGEGVRGVLESLTSQRERGVIVTLRLRRADGRHLDLRSGLSLIGSSGDPPAFLAVADECDIDRGIDDEAAGQHDALVRLSRFAIDLSMLPSDADLEAFVVRELVDISGAVGAVFTEFDSSRRLTTIKHVQVEARMLDRIVRMLDRQLIGFQASMSEEAYEEITSKVIRVHKTLHEGSFRSVPRPVSAAIQALLGADRFYGIGYLVEGNLFATSLMAMGRGTPDPPLEVLRSFSFLVALALRRRRAEVALRESEERHRLLADHASDVIWTMDIEGNFTYISPSVERLLGFTPAEAIRRSVIEALTPESAARALPVLTGAVEAIRAGRRVEGFRSELEQPRKDGSTVWTELSATELRDESGRFVGFLGVTRDISERKRAEISLQQSEERFRQLSSLTSEGIMIEDGGTIVDANRAFAELVGFSEPDALLGRDGLETVPFTVESRELVRRLRDSRSRETCEAQLARPDGSLVWVEVRGEPITYLGRRASLVSMRDVTDRKRAEADQRMSREILQILSGSEDIPAMVGQALAAIRAGIGFDAVGMRLEREGDYPYVAHHNFPEGFIAAENALLARDAVGDVCRDADGRPSLECTCGLVISGGPAFPHPMFTKGGSFWTNDSTPLLEVPEEDDPRRSPRNRCIHTGYLSIALVPVRHKERIMGLLHMADRRRGRLTLDAVERLESIAAHIGEAIIRKQAEAALLESQQRYEALVNLSPDAIIVDAGGVYAFANPAAARLLGADSPQELIGRSVIERVHADDRDLVARTSQQVLQGETPPPREIKLVRLDGSTVDTEVSAGAIEFDGRKVNQVVLRDITERKLAAARHEELERQLQESRKLESLGVLAGGIAHDFNNMLTAILGFSDIILASDFSSPDATFSDVTEIRHAAERAKALTGAILAFSRRQPREPKVLALGSLVADLEPLLRRTIGEHIQLICRTSAEAPLVEIDPGQFTQVLMNLVVNARDAMPSGGALSVEVAGRHIDEGSSASPALSAGEWAVLSVSDTGRGMDPDVVPRIFEPFYTTKGPGEGTGLGLSTAYGVVKQSGGDIVVRSAPGKGSTFEVYLPPAATTVEQDEASAGGMVASAPGRPGLSRMIGETVLLVEDEPAVRRLAGRILKDAGFTVLVAADGYRALSFAEDRSISIDVLLTDMVLPGELQGDEVARRILHERPAVKVVYMSGYPRDAIEQSGRLCLDEGACYLDKPFTAESLVAKLREALGRGLG